ncbi:MAG: hypothetical protein DRP80_07600, partial [Candidatus Omnitrophota bacterium]
YYIDITEKDLFFRLLYYAYLLKEYPQDAQRRIKDMESLKEVIPQSPYLVRFLSFLDLPLEKKLEFLKILKDNRILGLIKEIEGKIDLKTLFFWIRKLTLKEVKLTLKQRRDILKITALIKDEGFKKEKAFNLALKYYLENLKNNRRGHNLTRTKRFAQIYKETKDFNLSYKLSFLIKKNLGGERLKEAIRDVEKYKDESYFVWLVYYQYKGSNFKNLIPFIEKINRLLPSVEIELRKDFDDFRNLVYWARILRFLESKKIKNPLRNIKTLFLINRGIFRGRISKDKEILDFLLGRKDLEKVGENSKVKEALEKIRKFIPQLIKEAKIDLKRLPSQRKARAEAIIKKDLIKVSAWGLVSQSANEWIEIDKTTWQKILKESKWWISPSQGIIYVNSKYLGNVKDLSLRLVHEVGGLLGFSHSYNKAIEKIFENWQKTHQINLSLVKEEGLTIEQFINHIKENIGKEGKDRHYEGEEKQKEALEPFPADQYPIANQLLHSSIFLELFPLADSYQEWNQIYGDNQEAIDFVGTQSYIINTSPYNGDIYKYLSDLKEVEDLSSKLNNASYSAKTAFFDLFGEEVRQLTYQTPNYLKLLFDITGDPHWGEYRARFVELLPAAAQLNYCLQNATWEEKEAFKDLWGVDISDPATDGEYRRVLFDIVGGENWQENKEHFLELLPIVDELLHSQLFTEFFFGVSTYEEWMAQYGDNSEAWSFVYGRAEDVEDNYNGETSAYLEDLEKVKTCFNNSYFKALFNKGEDFNHSWDNTTLIVWWNYDTENPVDTTQLPQIEAMMNFAFGIVATEINPEDKYKGDVNRYLSDIEEVYSLKENTTFKKFYNNEEDFNTYWKNANHFVWWNYETPEDLIDT